MASARDYLDLADYRRRVQAIYADVRARYATDPRDAHARWRAERDDLFGRHPQSALTPERRGAFGGLRYYPYDPNLVFEAEVVPAVDEAPAPTLDVPMGDAHPIGCRRIGRVELPIGRLDLFWVEDYAGGLFLPFRDGTAGTGTYGGGRYLLDTAKGADLGTTPDGRRGSTSTSPTTRPATTPIAGPARSRRRELARGIGRGRRAALRGAMKRVLIVSPNSWERQQLADAPFVHGQYELLYHGENAEESPGTFDALGFVAATAETFRDQRLDGVASSSDYPGCLVAAAVARDLGLPGPDPGKLLLCSHKYYSRVAQREAVPEATPGFALVDPNDPTVDGLAFPLFVKPVKSWFSVFARKVDSPAELRAFVGQPQVRAFLDEFTRPFNQLLRQYTDLERDARYMLAEELASGDQVTVEGFVHRGRVEIMGVVDSIMHPGTISFARFDYPSRLPAEVQARMEEIARRAVAHVGLDESLFNIEMFHDPASGKITIIEINRAWSASSPTCTRRSTAPTRSSCCSRSRPARSRRCAAAPAPDRQAASFPLRVFEDRLIARVPRPEDLAAVDARFPGTRLTLYCHEGQRLSDAGDDRERHVELLLRDRQHGRPRPGGAAARLRRGVPPARLPARGGTGPPRLRPCGRAGARLRPPADPAQAARCCATAPPSRRSSASWCASWRCCSPTRRPPTCGSSRSRSTTPLATADGAPPRRPVGLVPILRAGLGHGRGGPGDDADGRGVAHRPLPRRADPAAGRVLQQAAGPADGRRLPGARPDAGDRRLGGRRRSTC